MLRSVLALLQNASYHDFIMMVVLKQDEMKSRPKFKFLRLKSLVRLFLFVQKAS